MFMAQTDATKPHMGESGLAGRKGGAKQKAQLSSKFNSRTIQRGADFFPEGTGANTRQ